MEERLRNTLTMVSEWLRYAEAKNAILVAADGAAIIGVLQTAGSLDQLHVVWRVYLYNLVVFAGLGLIIGLTSFLPTVDFGVLRPKGTKETGRNVFFFGTAANLSPERYLAMYYRVHSQSPPTSPHEYELLYAQQIIINSRITLWKLDRFKIAAWASLFALLTPPLALITWWVDRHSRVEPIANETTASGLSAHRN